LSWDEYVSIFGQPLDHAFLSDTVHGFFRNGGKKCFVVRVGDVSGRASAAGEGDPAGDQLAAAEAVLTDDNNKETMKIAAINDGRWGNRILVAVGDGSQPNLVLTTLAAESDHDKLTLDSTVDLKKGMEINLVPPRNAFGAVRAKIKAVDPGGKTIQLEDPLDPRLPRGTAVLGRGFKLIVTCGAQIEIFDNLSASPMHARYFADVINAPEASPYRDRPLQGFSILIHATPVLRRMGPSFRPQSLARPVPLTNGGDGSRSSTGLLRPLSGGGAIRLIARADVQDADGRGSRGNNIRVRAEAFTARAALAAAAGDESIIVENADGFTGGDQVLLRAPDSELSEQGTIKVVRPDNGIVLAAPLSKAFPIGTTVSVDGRFSLLVFQGENPEPIETHHNLSVDTERRSFAAELAAHSRILRGIALQAPTDRASVGEVSLAGGRDSGDIEPGWYTGYQGQAYFAPEGRAPGERYGLATLEGLGEIDLVAVPDLVNQHSAAAPPPDDEPYLSALRNVLDHAATCGDRFALLDAPAGATPGKVISIAQRLAENDTAKFGALYYPWLRLGDRKTGRTVPPSGFVAGVIARADQLGGVNRAPANYPLNDVVDLEILLDATEQDPLNRAGVNCIRRFERPVMELWGARTLSSDPASRYVNVRRLVIAVKKLLSSSLQWSVFEPNGPALWARIRTSLQSHMQTLVLGGATAAGGSGSFFVQCDAETNPPETSEAGQVIARVGIAPTEPAEFIFLNVTRAQGNVSVTEAG
jgi:hypothetical protein